MNPIRSVCLLDNAIASREDQLDNNHGLEEITFIQIQQLLQQQKIEYDKRQSQYQEIALLSENFPKEKASEDGNCLQSFGHDYSPNSYSDDMEITNHENFKPVSSKHEASARSASKALSVVFNEGLLKPHTNSINEHSTAHADWIMLLALVSGLLVSKMLKYILICLNCLQHKVLQLGVAFLGHSTLRDLINFEDNSRYSMPIKLILLPIFGTFGLLYILIVMLRWLLRVSLSSAPSGLTTFLERFYAINHVVDMAVNSEAD